MNIPEIEKKILEFWKENKIFEKSLAKKSPKGDFVFYDGPPFATGTPHYGHIVASLMKDMVPRYWTMRGYKVERKWGWDTHGLPIENIVEEELELKHKKDIEAIGVDRFNEIARSKVLKYVGEWKKVIERLGRWADMENAYHTMDPSFMESVWWVFKQLWDKKLIYEGYKSMHICPRCETTLSQHEVSDNYQDIEDISIIAKFELVDEPGTYILAWTTTPWTLPGNVALAIGKHINYVEVKSDDGKYILAEQNLDAIFGNKKHEIIGKTKAKDLEGKKYKPLFNYYLSTRNASLAMAGRENLYTIQLADFVTIEDGTGVVHIAPAFGEDDMNLGKEKNLPFIQHVKIDGQITDEAKDFVGLEVKPKSNPQSTDKKIIEFLEKKNLVFKTEKFIHSYPFCYRCESPLLNYATSSLFVNIIELKDKMLKYAKKINWVPEHIKEGRFGKWLEGARDWSISRQRFWGSVIPIWVCDKCKEKKVIGSIKELEELSEEKITDLHKHFMDKITFPCEKCAHSTGSGQGGMMRRIPDVLDCWFESGSMPYGQMHYPFENKEKFEENFPAQFIAEGVDQTRAWFYYLHVLASAIKGKEAFKNVIVNGMVLAEDGKKMSKHLNNYPDPMNVFEKHGADAVRYYLATSSVMKADDLCFSEKGVDEVVKKILLILLNVLSFYKMFESEAEASTKSKNVLDKWILSKIESLKKEITEGYNNYDLNEATRPLAGFIDELSTWYLRRSRERFKSDNKKEAVQTLKYVLLELSKIMAPVMPFTAEHIYKEIGGDKESVHLEDWPKVDKKLIDEKLEEKMEQIREICSMALQIRASKGIKVRQPLSELIIPDFKLESELSKLIEEEINVKKIVVDSNRNKDIINIGLRAEITPELKEEGMVRDFVRSVQVLRKKANLTPKDKIRVYYGLSSVASAKEGKEIIEKYAEQIKKQVIAEEIIFSAKRVLTIDKV
ncbi:isoleucine--tRNA ligase [Patescibacteria group bacterium]|nr:isoleucine--tRNA ligase [Patescibacteria group bacterium]MBU4458685.1 isoleucine--tRNA ligase [Patescibacteria group bacterium]MCG2696280.1 isoleucine--tRNA ligase [Candidatus Portnoybacteria bacterium]